MTEGIESVSRRLEAAAARLREERLDPREAAALVDECARLAGEAAAELELAVRAAGAEPGRARPGQRELLSGQAELLSGQAEPL